MFCVHLFFVVVVWLTVVMHQSEVLQEHGGEICFLSGGIVALSVDGHRQQAELFGDAEIAKAVGRHVAYLLQVYFHHILMHENSNNKTEINHYLNQIAWNWCVYCMTRQTKHSQNELLQFISCV